MVTTRSRTTSEAVTPTRATHADGDVPGSVTASGRTTRSRRGSTPLATPLGSPSAPLSPRTRARATASTSTPDSASKLRHAVGEGAPRTRASRATEIEFGDSDDEDNDGDGDKAQSETPNAESKSSDGIEIIEPPTAALWSASTLDDAPVEAGDDAGDDDDVQSKSNDEVEVDNESDGGHAGEEAAQPEPSHSHSPEPTPDATPAKKRTRTPRTSAAAHDAARAILSTGKSPQTPKDTVEVVLDAPRRGSKRSSMAEKAESPAKAAKGGAGDSPRTKAAVNGTPKAGSPKAKPKSKASPRASKADAAAPPTTSSGGGASARRRARQKDRIRALRAAAGVPLAAVDNDTASRLEASLRALLADKHGNESVCASRAARDVAAQTPGEAGAEWEALLPATRAVVLDLVKSRALAIVTGDPAPDAAGQLRVCRGPRF